MPILMMRVGVTMRENRHQLNRGRDFAPARAAGFSIVEALITLLILSVGLVALAKFSVSITREGGHAASRTQATILADQKLEEFRNYRDLATFDSYTSGSDVVGPTGSGTSIEMNNINQAYQRNWTVTDNGNYQNIDVQVSWPNNEGAYFINENTVTLQTNIARVNPATPALLPSS